MSRSNQIVTQFPALDHEPRGQGPPPSYRNSAATEDSWSTMSGSGPNQAMSGQRRNSWTNLVQVGGDPMVPKQAPPRPAAPMSTTFSATSRSSSVLAMQQHQPTVFTTQFSTQGQPLQPQKVFSTDPRLVSIPRPAGTIHSSGSMPGSRSGSIMIGSNPSPPRQKKKGKDSKRKDDNKPKRNRMQELKNFCKKPTVMGCCLCLLLTLIVAAVIIVILSQVLPSPKQANFTWIAPTSLTNGQNSSSRVEMKADKERIRFQITGAPPIKGNYINYYDFDKNQVVVIDQSLNANGKNLYCFILPLDRSSMPNPGDVRKAAKSSVLRHQQEDGWQQVWSWIPSPLQQTNAAQSMFSPPIPECNGSRIVQLQPTSDQRNRRCTDCYDFCLPQYGIMRNASDNNDEYLNIKQQDCFYLFVPEWRTYAQANTMEQNQQDFENYYRNRQHMQVSYGSNGPNDSRWIPLSGMPRQMMNATGAFVGQVGNAIGNLGSNVYGIVTGQGQQQGQQQQQVPQNMQNSGNPQAVQQQQNYGVPVNGPPGPVNTVSGAFGANGQYQNAAVAQMQQQRIQNQQQQMQQNLQPSGYHPAVNGVVNLNGVNGVNGNTEYNVQPYQGTGSNGQNIGPEMRRQVPYTFNSNINSGYTNQQPQVSSGSTNTNMNGFGASPSYQTQQYGFNNNDPRNQVGGLNGNGLGNSVNSQHQISVSAHTNAPRIGSVLNEFGNPVSIHPSQQSVQSQPGMITGQVNQVVPQGYGGQITNPNYISTSGGVAPDDGDVFSQRLQQLMGNPSQYRPDVEPVNYNVPQYSQPNRPDALSRQGRIFK